jgi:hypothetical protein
MIIREYAKLCCYANLPASLNLTVERRKFGAQRRTEGLLYSKWAGPRLNFLAGLLEISVIILKEQKVCGAEAQRVQRALYLALDLGIRSAPLLAPQQGCFA